MKFWVKYSLFVWVLTIGITICLLGSIIFTLRDGRHVSAFILGFVLVAMFVSALIYAPLWIGVDDDVLLVRRPLHMRRIPIADIADAHMHTPTMGATRISASGGWFGYWGWFMEADTGRYFAYYGRSCDCFMVTLKNGRKYLLGCVEPQEILSRISKSK